jgi:hypothetical protein
MSLAMKKKEKSKMHPCIEPVALKLTCSKHQVSCTLR